MSIVNRQKKKNEESVQEVPQKQINNSGLNIDLSLQELEFLIRLIGTSNFKGNDLMFIYDLVNKLQNLYLDKKED
tara:strand:- start:1580 stop:1804 length:225 start_codon:yes stop_codon:yes gene_type:complete